MAFTYSGDPAASDLDYLRFMIGDTHENSAMLQDAELQYILDTNTSTTQCLAKAFRAAATTLGARLIKRSLGPQSEDATKRHDYYAAQAERYEKISRYSATPPSPEYQADLVFEKDMMANDV